MNERITSAKTSDTKKKGSISVGLSYNIDLRQNHALKQNNDINNKAEGIPVSDAQAVHGFGHNFQQIRVHDQLESSFSGSEKQSCPISSTTPRACPFGGACHICPAKVQTKLAINRPGDKYEQEADRIADAVANNKSIYSAGNKLTSVSGEKLQREEGKETPKTDEEKYKEGLKKAGEAFLKTNTGKQIKDKAEKLGKDFIATLPGKIIAGSAAAGVVTAIAATNSELPMQIPEIPLDIITPGLKIKLIYEGPARKPANASITFIYEEQVKKTETKKPDEKEAYRAETARMAQELEQFREGLKTPEQRAAEQELFWQAYWGMKGPYGIEPLNIPGLQQRREEEVIQRKENNNQQPVESIPPIVHDVLNSGGQPLDSDTREFMESRFGHDFSKVKVHTDTNAVESAREINALAYTVGQDIVFGQGQYSPWTADGNRLMAHELTHVIQQSSQFSRANFSLSSDALNETPYFSNSVLCIYRKISHRIDTIRSNLSLSVTDWMIREYEVREVLDILKELNDIDLRATLSELEDKLIDRIFTKVGKDDAQKEAFTLQRVRELRTGKSLLTHIPSVLICKKPSKGDWEMAQAFQDLTDMVKTVRTSANLVPAPVGPRLFAKLGVLAHGDMGGVIQIGTTVVNIGNIDSYASEFKELEKFITFDGIFYIFGCVSGVGRAGSALLKEISMILPGRKIVGFNVITSIALGEAKMPGEMCVWPDIRATDIKSEIFRQLIKKRVPATENAPQAKIAKDGKIIKWPIDENKQIDDGTKESESRFFKPKLRKAVPSVP